MHALRDADFPGDGFMIIQGHRGKCKPSPTSSMLGPLWNAKSIILRGLHVPVEKSRKPSEIRSLISRTARRP